DHHTISGVVQRILKNPVCKRPRRPAEAVPFGKRARVDAAHIRETTTDINVRSQNADTVHAASAAGAESRPGPAAPLRDAEGRHAARHAKTAPHIQVVSLKG